jgi:hypothetical protein
MSNGLILLENVSQSVYEGLSWGPYVDPLDAALFAGLVVFIFGVLF